MLEKVVGRTQKIEINKALELSANKDALFIDVRTPKEYNGYHVENAINIPFERLLDEQYERLFNNEQLKVLYGTSSVDANAAWMILTQYGYDHLFVLDAGIEDWVARNESKGINKDQNRGDEVALFEYGEVMIK